MRSLVTFAVAAMAALGLPAAGLGQGAVAASPSDTALTRCNWQPIGQFSSFAPRALAITTDGSLLLAGDDLSDAAHSALVTMRWQGPGASWEVVDRYLPDGALASGARALHVDVDGNVYVLAWVQQATTTDLLLRRSFGGGEAGTWESSETRWPAEPGGALASDPDGRLYVAYGFAGPDGIGWRVESALRGTGAFTVEDELGASGAYAAVPQDMKRAASGALYVAGQLHGTPDQWVVRARGGARRKAGWQTIDQYELSPSSYGLTPRAIAPLTDGRLLVAGLGVAGASTNDYQWVERWQAARNRWQTRKYQLQAGMTTMAQDAAATTSGAAVLGVATTATGTSLVLRESSAGGQAPKVVLEVDGVTDPWAARLAVSGEQAAVAATIEGKATVLSCALR